MTYRVWVRACRQAPCRLIPLLAKVLCYIMLHAIISYTIAHAMARCLPYLQHLFNSVCVPASPHPKNDPTERIQQTFHLELMTWQWLLGGFLVGPPFSDSPLEDGDFVSMFTWSYLSNIACSTNVFFKKDEPCNKLYEPY